ncbi:hypothetical protein MMU07_10940, partial [Aquiflexum sp. LQ15W]|uniref:hypothetical protein n=1 Tax=Cognataquiflexum nitidum TaxID=2922272 RepID=UPI001F1335E3
YTISIPQWTVNFRKGRNSFNPLFSLSLLWFNILSQISQVDVEDSLSSAGEQKCSILITESPQKTPLFEQYWAFFMA